MTAFKSAYLQTTVPISVFERVNSTFTITADDLNAYAEDLIKLICIAILWHKKGRADKGQTAYAKTWAIRAKPFLEHFGIRTRAFLKMADGLARGAWDDPTYEALGDFGDDIQAKWSAIQKSSQLYSNTFTLLRDAALWCRSDSEPAVKRIENNIGLLKDANLSRMFVSDVDHEAQSGITIRLKKVVQQLRGRATNTDHPTRVSVMEAKRLKDAKPDLYKRYLELRKQANEIYKGTLKKLVRTSGDHLIQVKDLRNKLKALKIDVHSVPDGLDGDYYLDEKGAIYTPAKKKLKSNPGPIAEIEMNPNYDPKTDSDKTGGDQNYPLKARYPQEDGSQGNWQLYYTEEKVSSRKKAVFEKVDKLADVLPKVRKKWLAAIRQGPDVNNQATLALMLEVAYETQARIGGEQNETGGKVTYGLSTWRMNNVRKAGGGYRFRYVGKKGVTQVHDLLPTDPDSKLVCKRIRELHMVWEDEKHPVTGEDTEYEHDRPKTPKEYLFTDHYGRPYTGTQVNNYLKSLGVPAGITIHKLRHARGNKLAKELIQQALPGLKSKKPAPNEAESFFKSKIATKVALLLGHKKETGEPIWSTSVKSYINPQTTQSFFDGVGSRYPKWLEDLLR